MRRFTWLSEIRQTGRPITVSPHDAQPLPEPLSSGPLMSGGEQPGPDGGSLGVPGQTPFVRAHGLASAMLRLKFQSESSRTGTAIVFVKGVCIGWLLVPCGVIGRPGTRAASERPWEKRDGLRTR